MEESDELVGGRRREEGAGVVEGGEKKGVSGGREEGSAEEEEMDLQCSELVDHSDTDSCSGSENFIENKVRSRSLSPKSVRSFSAILVQFCLSARL